MPESTQQRLAIAGTVAALAARVVRATAPRNWPSFRGDGGAGNGDGQRAVAEWDVATGKNIKWKTPIPGVATSSPIVWGNRAFVTTAVSQSLKDVAVGLGIPAPKIRVIPNGVDTSRFRPLDRDSARRACGLGAGRRILLAVGGLSDHVRFAGPRPPAELPLWYAAADAFCLATRSEGWANVLLESIACGIPVVTTRVGGNPEIVREGVEARAG